MGDVKADHAHVAAAREDVFRGLRVAENIGFRGGVDVAGRLKRAAENDELAPLRMQVGLLLQGERDVCARGERQDRHLAGPRRHGLDDEVDG